MKTDSRSQNIYIFKQLRTAFGKYERITVQEIKDGDFKQYREVEDLFYETFERGSIQLDHIFAVA